MSEHFDAAHELNQLLPTALKVIREVIEDDGRDGLGPDESGKTKIWTKPALDTSIWLVEKVTGKPKTEDERKSEGLLIQLLSEIRDRKAASAANPETQHDSFTKTESNSVDTFVDRWVP